MLCQISYILSVNRNPSFCHIIESRNQVDQCRFTTSGASDKCCRFSRFCGKCNVMQYIFFCSRIVEGYMFKCNFSFAVFRKCLWLLWIMDFCLALQDFIHTLCWNCCSWKHNRNHTNHKEWHNNLHCILDKCHHISDLHCSVINTVSTGPHNQNGNPIHHKHHSRHHKCHGTVDK